MWLIAVPFLHAVPVAAILTLSPLVLVALVLRVVSPPRGAEPLYTRVWWAAAWAQLPCAVLLTGSFMFDRGTSATILAVPWVGLCGLLALLGLLRMRTRRNPLPWSELSIDAGLGMVVVGAVWAVADRAGVPVLHFSPAIILLTGVHFHYAGFVLPVVAGLLARRFPGPMHRAAVLLTLAGVPLTAYGITTSPPAEIVGAWVTVVAGLTVASGCARTATRTDTPSPARPLLIVGALAFAWAMLVAATYAYGEFVHRPFPSLDRMAWLHGLFNSLGFALPVLVAENLVEDARTGGSAPP